MSIKPKAVLYRTIWRWHFYAGLFCIPFIISLSVSGAIFLFKPQIDQWNEAPYHHITTEGQRQLPNAQIRAALNTLPEAKFYNYRLPLSPQHAVKIDLMFKGERYSVFINPFSLEVLATEQRSQQFINLVRNFHGELLSGTLGAILIELAGCWTIVLILSGLYLWWPRNAQGLGGVLYPRLKLPGRQLWKDLHAVIGIWVSFFTLFLLITGLPWALVWGAAFKELRTIGKEKVTLDWSSEQTQEQLSWGANAVTVFDLQPEVLELAESLKLEPPVELSVSNEENNIWKLASVSQNRPLRAEARLSGKHAVVLKTQAFSDKKTIDKVIGFGIAAHEGQLFGWFNQLLGLLTTLGLLIISMSGFVLWRSRKPECALGAPPTFPSTSAPKIVAILIFSLALVLPVLLASLLGLFIIEFCLLKRFAVVREWLGIPS